MRFTHDPIRKTHNFSLILFAEYLMPYSYNKEFF